MKNLRQMVDTLLPPPTHTLHNNRVRMRPAQNRVVYRQQFEVRFIEKKNHFASYFDLFYQTFIPIGTIFKALLAQLMDCHQVNDYAVLLYVYVIPDHN